MTQTTEKLRAGIRYPLMNGFCEKCVYHYLLDGDESRCCHVWIGMSHAMCAQVSECRFYCPKNRDVV